MSGVARAVKRYAAGARCHSWAELIGSVGQRSELRLDANQSIGSKT